jgi:phosphoribosyl-AMP cyclohydrolase
VTRTERASAAGDAISATGTAPPGRPLTADDAHVDAVRFGDDGLVVAVVQDAALGDVLTVAYMNDAALRRTLQTGRSWFWSRSRQELWCKGETSGDRQYVREVWVDCDGDALLVIVDQHGDAACHTKQWSCFYRSVGTGPGAPRLPGETPATATRTTGT